MSLDEMIRTTLAELDLPFDRQAEASAIRHRVARRRHRRRAVAIPAAAAIVGALALAVATRPSGDADQRVTTEATTTTTSTTPDPFAGAGICRSLLPQSPEPPTPSSVPDATADPTPPTAYLAPAEEPQADTPCSRAVADAVRTRLPEGWELWAENPFDMAPISETAGDGYGTATVALIDGDGALLQITIGYGPPGDRARIEGFGTPLDDLPEGWKGTTDFVPGEDRRIADVTVVRPGRVPVMVAVLLGQPTMEAPAPAGTVLPLGYEQVRDLAVDLAWNGPVQSP